MEQDAVEAGGKHADAMVRFACVLVGPSGADDLAATAMLRVLSRASWRDVDDLQPYLYRALLNEARMQRRSADRRLRREISAARAAGAETSDLVRIEVLDALRRLDVRQRSVVPWVDRTGEPDADGATLHVPLGEVEPLASSVVVSGEVTFTLVEIPADVPFVQVGLGDGVDLELSRSVWTFPPF